MFKKYPVLGRLTISLLLIFIFLPFITFSKREAMDSVNELYANFLEPGPAYRAKPFWAWNGDLDKDELLRQIHVMKDMGFGGFFMHSRTGLKTEYLGDKWFEMINVCTDEGKKLGLEPWLYDEDRWPSGTAGGMVTKNPEFRARFISLKVVPSQNFVWNDSAYAVFACDINGINCSKCKRINKKTPPASIKDKSILVFKIEEASKSSFYNGYTDVDRLNKDATQKFIELTHDKYKEKCGNRFGTSIYGIFTDEPHRQSVFNGFSNDNPNKFNMAPWTALLPKLFKEKYGYDISDKLPDLFLNNNSADVAPVKWQYMELLEEMFLDNWVKPYQKWCLENRKIFTGHFLHEDNLTSQAAMQGSLMRAYEYQEYPGIDVLWEGNMNYWIVKQLQSSARQTGKKWLLSETYGVTGWQTNFESYKAMSNWQALFGINLRCPHLSWYTMEGEAKRDYPASILHQSTWWKDYNYVETYFARLAYLLGQGKPVCDVLVVNPVESVWSRIHTGWANGLQPVDSIVKNLEASYKDVFHWLEGNQIDFDYGDEEMLGRLYSISKDSKGTPLFNIGQASYKTVVVAGMTNIRKSTLDALDKFIAAGGKVIFAGTPPAYVNATPSKAAEDFAKKADMVAFKEDALTNKLKTTLSNPVQIVTEPSGKSVKDIFCQYKIDGDRSILTVMNMNRKDSFDLVRISVAAKGFVSEWDCATGKRYKVKYITNDQKLVIYASFPRSGQHIFVITPQEITGLEELPACPNVGSLIIEGPFDFELDENNVCVLDMAKFQINTNPVSEETEILKIDKAVRDYFKMPHRGGEMVQPWFSAKFMPQPQVKGKVKVMFPFYIDKLPGTPISFCMETPSEFKIKINGKPVELKSEGWWVDIAFKKFTIPKDYLKVGENILEQEMDFREDINLESIYLLGNFGVRLSGAKKTIGALPTQLFVGDITSQGLPFYSGAIKYKIPVNLTKAKLKSAWLRLPGVEGAFVKVGTKEKMLAWAPFEADIADDIATSKTVDVKVVLTRRNTFGPMHMTPFTRTTAPSSFVTTGKNFTNNYVLFPCGLLAAPQLLIDSY